MVGPLVGNFPTSGKKYLNALPFEINAFDNKFHDLTSALLDTFKISFKNMVQFQWREWKVGGCCRGYEPNNGQLLGRIITKSTKRE